ncbi:MAG: GntR family transcriptional regulator [Kiritimatiellae bacterium]|nr:GntR family transcriptional regulator [Kiritimatiellia bacterium]
MKLPFSITPDIRASLTDKIVDGIRSAIQSGRYSPGDRLPGTRTIAKELGISVRAPTEAFRRLADEGLLEVRTKSGAVVRERGAKAWKGHVLVVLPDGEYNYFQNVFAGRFANRLAKGGYLTSLVTTPRGHGGRHDISTLEVALSGSVDFAFCVRQERTVVAALSANGVRFAVVSDGDVRRLPRGCVAVVPHDMSGAVAELVAHCRRAGVGKVLVVCKSIEDDHFSRGFAGSGVVAERMVVPPKTSGGRELRIVNIQRAVVERFERLFAERGREWLPDLLFFSDDHAATSGVITLLSHGVRIPHDVKIASVTNKGLGPAMPVPLTAIELSAVSAAYDMADATLGFLSCGKFPQGLRIERQYRIGGTFA